MEVLNIKKHKINDEYIKKYNFIIRGIPSGMFTKEHLTDTFPNILNLTTETYEDELIAYFNFEDDYANYLYKLLDGKVFQMDKYWYPIQVIYKDKNYKIFQSKQYKKKEELSNEMMSCIFLTICLIYIIFIHYF
jgi:hypothetical protein